MPVCRARMRFGRVLQRAQSPLCGDLRPPASAMSRVRQRVSYGALAGIRCPEE